MKRIINQPSDREKSISGYPFNLCKQHFKNMLLLVFICHAFTGCFRHYFKVDSKEVIDAASIEQLKAANKYFILHFEDRVMGTQQLSLVNDRLEAELVALPKEHAHHVRPNLNKKNGMKAKQQANTLMEVHLYANTAIPSTETHIAVPIKSISRIDIYEMDASATRQSHILSTVGLTTSGILIIGTLVLILTGEMVDMP